MYSTDVHNKFNSLTCTHKEIQLGNAVSSIWLSNTTYYYHVYIPASEKQSKGQVHCNMQLGLSPNKIINSAIMSNQTKNIFVAQVLCQPQECCSFKSKQKQTQKNGKDAQTWVKSNL